MWKLGGPPNLFVYCLLYMHIPTCARSACMYALNSLYTVGQILIVRI